MTDDGRGYITDTLVILIFVYLSGIATGILGSAYWRRPTADGKEEAENAPPPAPTPDPIQVVERVRTIAPPSAVRVGISSSCYAYHDVDNFNGRCEEVKAFAAQASENPGGKVSKKFFACKKCFPGGAYREKSSEPHFTPDGQPRGARPRHRDIERVPIQVYD